MRLAALALAVCLSACVFSSETPLLDSADAVAPFADGAQFAWTDSSSGPAPAPVRSRLGADRVYTITSPNGAEEEPLVAQFFDVPDTPEEDFLVQAQLEPGEAWIYAFMWRDGENHLIFVDPSELGGDLVAHAHCLTRGFGECQVRSAEALRAIYREYVYPRFVLGGARVDVLVQSPFSQTPQRTNPPK